MKEKSGKRQYCRCYNCQFYKPRSKSKGFCSDIKQKVDAIDFCNEGIPKTEGEA